MQKMLIRFLIASSIFFFIESLNGQNNMRWIKLDTIAPEYDLGTCSDSSSCDLDKRVQCYALVYEPSYSLVLTSYTTFFRIDCAADSAHSLVYNESCIMTDNSTATQACPLIEQRFNCSANSGTIEVDSGQSYVIHQICVQVAIGDTIVLEIREPPTQNVQSNSSLGYGQAAQTENLDVEDLVVVGVPCVAESDSDLDGVTDSLDNCWEIENSDQLDTDMDGIGNVCDEDDDNDGCLDVNDSQPLIASIDSDCDGVGDDCDICEGADDSVDYNQDGIPDCSQLLEWYEYSPDWNCMNKKILLCKSNGTRCRGKKNRIKHFNQGKFIGPCTDCEPYIPELETRNELQSVEYAAFGTLYPNPTQDYLYIALNEEFEAQQTAIYRIYSIDGVLRMSGEVVVQSDGLLQLSIHGLQSGRYYIQISTEAQIFTKSFIVST